MANRCTLAIPNTSLAADTVTRPQNETCRAYNLEEVRERVFGLANALSGLYGISTLTCSLDEPSC